MQLLVRRPSLCQLVSIHVKRFMCIQLLHMLNAMFGTGKQTALIVGCTMVGQQLNSAPGVELAKPAWHKLEAAVY